VLVWNALLIPIILSQSPSTETLTVAVAAVPGQYGVSDSVLAASTLIGSAPLIIVLLLGQKYVVRGFMEGGVL
jgi:ABC-type glycerol-3-phosphate transport system permease component